jgi:hypothetical protein
MSVDLKVLIRESIERLLEEDVKFAEGETVKTTDGKKGEITLAKHPFYAIALSDGSTRSYHFSDLIKGVQEKMEYKGDKKDLSPALEFHIKNGLSLFENVFRPESKAYFDLFAEARKLYNEGLLKLTKEEIELLESGIGETVILENKTVHLGLPFLGDPEFINEAEDKKQPALGKPHRGGSKKFYVYVKNPKTKKIKKVSFGDTTGLRAKLNNPKARQAFAARHKCAQKKDRTKASYWSCRLPRYAKLLGFKTSFSGYW